ncbi:MAG TPA: BREX protein BrxB domain-containing protein [Prolixibacteraceae bacterium]|nr:BREX protein BrxB domain-containing protein [Prolixibacteraceae bacterium]
MTINELYDLLCDEDFQDPKTGNLFFPAYMYIYDPTKEYYIREQIQQIKDRLIRPNTFVDVLIINLFTEFLDYLKTRTFGTETLLNTLLANELKDSDRVTDSLRREAVRGEFLSNLNDKIKEHIQPEDDLKKSFVFVHGFGEIYPYLRASKFLSNFEKYITGYKIILFYPGTVKDNYSMFDLLNDENPYRAIKLINPEDQLRTNS